METLNTPDVIEAAKHLFTDLATHVYKAFGRKVSFEHIETRLIDITKRN